MSDKRSHLTFQQKVKLFQFLEDNIEILENNQCVYKDRNVNDDTVAKQFNTTLAVVRKLRQEQFGNLRSWTRGPAKHQNFELLLAQVKELTEHIKDLEAKYNKLVLALSLNKVADVKHLVTNSNWSAPQ